MDNMKSRILKVMNRALADLEHASVIDAPNANLAELRARIADVEACDDVTKHPPLAKLFTPEGRLNPRQIAMLYAVADGPAKGYEGQEMSSPPSNVAQVEALRKAMKPEQVKEFSKLTDLRCRAAYEANADWFVKLTRAKSNRGRDQLYVWVTHWLVSYLLNPESFRRGLEGL